MVANPTVVFLPTSFTVSKEIVRAVLELRLSPQEGVNRLPMATFSETLIEDSTKVFEQDMLPSTIVIVYSVIFEMESRRLRLSVELTPMYDWPEADTFTNGFVESKMMKKSCGWGLSAVGPLD